MCKSRVTGKFSSYWYQLEVWSPPTYRSDTAGSQNLTQYYSSGISEQLWYIVIPHLPCSMAQNLTTSNGITIHHLSP